MVRASDILGGVVTAAIGAFFFWGAGRIEVYGGDVIPADFFPKVVSALIFALGTVLAISRFWESRAVTSQEGAVRASADWSDFIRVTLPLTLLTLCYILAWRAFGYLIATLLVAPPIFFVFGNRGVKWALLLPVAVAITFFLAFFGVMGLYDAPGRVFDQQIISRLLHL